MKNPALDLSSSTSLAFDCRCKALSLRLTSPQINCAWGAVNKCNCAHGSAAAGTKCYSHGAENCDTCTGNYKKHIGSNICTTEAPSRRPTQTPTTQSPTAPTAPPTPATLTPTRKPTRPRRTRAATTGAPSSKPHARPRSQDTNAPTAQTTGIICSLPVAPYAQYARSPRPQLL